MVIGSLQHRALPFTSPCDHLHIVTFDRSIAMADEAQFWSIDEAAVVDDWRAGA